MFPLIYIYRKNKKNEQSNSNDLEKQKKKKKINQILKGIKKRILVYALQILN